jgi:tRNA pseudouridine38-40 synthase
VQGALEEALAKLLGEESSIVGAGRTDAGVHATGQVASFRTANPMALATIERGVNALLPADVAVSAVREVPQDFHARFSAIGRTYEYTIWNGPRPRPLLRRTAWWVPDPLDAAAMERASVALVGRHDFSAFAMKAAGSRERTVRRAAWSAGEGVLVLTIEADGFLRGMVRGIVGTLLQVGRGRLGVADFADVLASADRDRGGTSAPAQGLCLVQVRYGSGADEAKYDGRAADEEDE